MKSDKCKDCFYMRGVLGMFSCKREVYPDFFDADDPELNKMQCSLFESMDN